MSSSTRLRPWAGTAQTQPQTGNRASGRSHGAGLRRAHGGGAGVPDRRLQPLPAGASPSRLPRGLWVDKLGPRHWLCIHLRPSPTPPATMCSRWVSGDTGLCLGAPCTPGSRRTGGQRWLTDPSVSHTAGCPAGRGSLGSQDWQRSSGGWAGPEARKQEGSENQWLKYSVSRGVGGGARAQPRGRLSAWGGAGRLQFGRWLRFRDWGRLAARQRLGGVT